ncbi:hypothetical protein VTH82DRAFT_2478 [Thermothelomyces myriococcoides]
MPEQINDKNDALIRISQRACR